MAITTEMLDELCEGIAGDLEALDRVCAADVVFTDPATTVNGLAAARDYFGALGKAFPDATIKIVSTLISGDQAAVELVYSGTHLGPMLTPTGEIAPTGRYAESPGGAFLTARDGKVIRFRDYFDQLSWRMDLGLMPGVGAE